MPLAAGTKLGPYEILSPIGAGGMGEVYRAHDSRLHRTIAIKVLTHDPAGDDAHRSLLLQEARAAAALSQANIVTVYDVGSDAGTDFIAMECVDGETLGEFLASQTSPLAETLAFTISICDALAAAHAKGIVHRDLKPGNIMVTRDRQIKVVDFGLAKLPEEDLGTEDSTRTQILASREGVLRGTLAYMSPEQARGRKADSRADIFSLGAVLYEMLTGRRAFAGATGLEVLAAVLAEEPKNLHDFRSGLPRQLDPIVRKAMAKKPENRYQHIEDLRADVEKVRQRLAPRPGRRWLVAASLLAAVAVAAGVLYLRRNARIAWVHAHALPEIASLAAKGDYVSALRLAESAEKIIPGGPQLASLFGEVSTRVTIETTPVGTSVEMKEYTAPDDRWTSLGKTPLQQVRVPLGYFRWRVSKPGFAATEVAFATTGGTRVVRFSLDPERAVPTDMVRVPGGQFFLNITELGGLGPYQLEPFYIDKFEVTNREFKQFVDRGGYGKRDYWKQPFVMDGRTLTWEEAMDRFRDATGRQGPSTWEGGRYPEGFEDYPVTGVSWYEAVAYAEFFHKSLPTIAHWYIAADISSSPYVVPRSNFGGKVLARAGEYKGLGTYGTYDMAGNAKEWCWNESALGQHFVLGGAWSEPAHMFTNNSDTRPAFDRGPLLGFRCIKVSGTIPPELLASKPRGTRDYSKVKPVSDEIYRAYLNQFTYDRTDPAARLEATEETAGWKKEKVSIAGTYGGERLPAYVFTPKSISPPYQTVIYFAGAGAAQLTSSETLQGGPQYLTVVRSGRAVVYPVFWGTYERYNQRALQRTSAARRERTLNWARDLNRVADYIEARADLDKTRIGYLGFSQGAWVAPVLAAAEPRIKTLVLLSGGLPMDSYPPEVDAINFAPRLKRPVLMINGRYDFTFPYEASQLPLFRFLGTPEKDKRHVVYDAAHDVSLMSAEMNHEMLSWLDKYLGKVR